MFQDSVTVKGEVRITNRHPDGSEEHRLITNLVVSGGKGFIASRMVGTTPAVMTSMAVGTDNTAPAITDTALHAELAGSRVAFDSATAAGAVTTYAATFGPGIGTGAIVEAGIFNATSAGLMLSRVVFPVVNKGASDTMSVTWTITVT